MTVKKHEHTTSRQSANAGFVGKESWGLLKWKQKAKIKKATPNEPLRTMPPTPE